MVGGVRATQTAFDEGRLVVHSHSNTKLVCKYSLFAHHMVFVEGHFGASVATRTCPLPSHPIRSILD
jgi:hypothetical protein